MACSVARALDVIGEPWSPLILRDVNVGLSRFEQMQADLGISPGSPGDGRSQSGCLSYHQVDRQDDLAIVSVTASDEFDGCCCDLFDGLLDRREARRH